MKANKSRIIIILLSLVLFVSIAFVVKKYSDYIIRKKTESEMLGYVLFDYYNYVRNNNCEPQKIIDIYPEKLPSVKREVVLFDYMRSYYHLLSIGDSVILVKSPFGIKPESELYYYTADSNYTIVDFLSNKPIILSKWPRLKMPCDYNFLLTSDPYFYVSPAKLKNDSVFKSKVSKMVYQSIYQCCDSSSVRSFPSWKGNYLIQVVSTSEGYTASYICKHDTINYSNKVLLDIKLRFDSAEIADFDTIIKQVHKYVEE